MTVPAPKPTITMYQVSEIIRGLVCAIEYNGRFGYIAEHGDDEYTVHIDTETHTANAGWGDLDESSAVVYDDYAVVLNSDLNLSVRFYRDYDTVCTWEYIISRPKHV